MSVLESQHQTVIVPRLLTFMQSYVVNLNRTALNCIYMIWHKSQKVQLFQNPKYCLQLQSSVIQLLRLTNISAEQKILLELAMELLWEGDGGNGQ